MKKIIYRVIVMCFAVVLLLTGAYIGLRISDNVVAEENVEPEPVAKVEEPTTTVINKSEEKDIEVTYEDYYLNCKESIINKNIEFGTTIEDIKKNVDKEYKLVEETENSIIFRKEVDSNCPNHFKFVVEDGYVKIYQILNDGIYEMYKSTEISETGIREELLEQLKKGIEVNSLEELNTYLEDMES